MGQSEIFATSAGALILVTVFWITVFSIIFGLGTLCNGAIATTLAFFVIGATFLIGHFGWQILVIPSLANIGGVGVLI